METTNQDQIQRKRRTRDDWSLKKLYHDAVDKAAIKGFLDKTIWKSKTDTDSLYTWKYERVPFGKTLMLVGENSGQEIIGLGLFMPWKLHLDSQTIGACQWIDLIVSFSYRGQGIPDRILQDGLAEFRANKGPVCFAFPNENSVPVHKANNGFLLGYIRRYVKPLKTGYLIQRFVKVAPLGRLLGVFADFFLRLFSKETFYFSTHGLKIEATSSCGSDFDEFWKQFSRKYSTMIMTEKTASYLNWKYLQSPKANRKIFCAKKNNEIQGFIVLEAGERSGYIVDVAALSDEALSVLTAYAIKYFRRLNKDSVVFICLENNMFLKVFKSFGLVAREEKSHFYIYVDEALEQKEFFRDSRNWFITIGDCDIDSM